METHFYAKAAACIAAGLAIGIGSIGPALGLGMIGSKACECIGKYPESAGRIRGLMIVAMGLTEAVAIYALIIGILLVVLKA